MPLRFRAEMETSYSPEKLWNPGVDRGERLPLHGHPAAVTRRLEHYRACGWQPSSMFPRVGHSGARPPTEPEPEPEDDRALPAWKLMGEDAAYGNLDLIEAIGTLELGVYVPMPLPWERPSTSAVSSSSSARCGRGLEGGKHSEGFVTTLRDLSGRTGRFGGEASAVHSAEPSAAQHFVRATADLVSRTNAIALMTESVSKGPTAALGGEGGGTRRRTTQLPGGGAQSTVTSMKRDVVMRESRRLQSRATTPGGDGGGSSGGTVAQLMDLTAQIRSVVAEHPNVVAVFRQYDDDGDGTLDLLEFRDGLKSMGLHVTKELARLLFTQISGDGGAIRYEEFVRSFEPDAHMRAMAQLAATTTNNLACLKLRQNPRTALPLLTSSLRMQREHMAKQHHARLAEQLFQKVDVDGSGSIEEPEIAALSQRLGRKLNRQQLRAAMRAMDADGSGEVDLEEFQTWFAQQKAIDCATTQLNLAAVLVLTHQPAEALRHARGAFGTLTAVLSPPPPLHAPAAGQAHHGTTGAASSSLRSSPLNGPMGASPPSASSFSMHGSSRSSSFGDVTSDGYASSTQKSRTKRSVAELVAGLRPRDEGAGSIAVVACLVLGEALQGVCASYADSVDVCEALRMAAVHAERWWGEASPLAQAVGARHQRFNARIHRCLTPSARLSHAARATTAPGLSNRSSVDVSWGVSASLFDSFGTLAVRAVDDVDSTAGYRQQPGRRRRRRRRRGGASQRSSATSRPRSGEEDVTVNGPGGWSGVSMEQERSTRYSMYLSAGVV